MDSPDHIAHVNPFRYRGYYYDAETGFYWLQSRYYDPEVGRFLNSDKVIAGIGESIQGYNVFAYCFNNPINLSDPTGNWPKWVETIGSRFVHTVKTIGRIISAPFKATEVSVGAGVGIGIRAKTSVSSMNVEVNATSKNVDSISLNKNGFKAYNTSYSGVDVVIGPVKVGRSCQRSHSYNDPNCTCSFFKSSVGEKMNCPANEPVVQIENAKIEFGVSAYFILGAEVSASIDLKALGDEYISIYHESIKYED